MSTIYIPPNCHTLDKITTKQQVRVGIQGYPGSGKTFSALSFNNPIVLNLDRGLGAHQGRKDVIEVPFYLSTFSGGKTRTKDKLIEWLDKEGSKLTEEQTLVFDGLSSLEVAYHAWFDDNRVNYITKSGKLDEFAEWQVKKKFFGEIMELFKTLKCDVIMLAHEAARADRPTTVGQYGEYTGKIRPLLTGAYGDIIVRDFTDWFRQLSTDKPKDYNSLTPEILSSWGMKSRDEFRAMCDMFPRNTIYYWQLEGDIYFDGKCSSLVKYPRYLPATYQAFSQYRRKIS